jgi:hypothetical protein
MSFLSSVLSTTRFVVDNARYVTIDHERVASVAAELAAQPMQPVTYDCTRHLCGTDPEVANFVLVLDTLNFSFWPDPGLERWSVTIDGETLDGYWALVAALRRALANGMRLTDATFLSGIAVDTLLEILRGEGTIPLIDERADALREVGRGLLRRDGGEFVNMIERAGRNAVSLSDLLATELGSFADVATYGGQEVRFLKRAQICASDAHGASGGKDWGNLVDLDRLTAFADYKVPQVLRRLGILVYADALAQPIDNHVPLESGSEGEVEIRAATIWGVEYLRRALARRGMQLRAFEIDWHLWELGQRLPPDTRPYHRTRTVYY